MSGSIAVCSAWHWTHLITCQQPIVHIVMGCVIGNVTNIVTNFLAGVVISFFIVFTASFILGVIVGIIMATIVTSVVTGFLALIIGVVGIVHYRKTRAFQAQSHSDRHHYKQSHQ